DPTLVNLDHLAHRLAIRLIVHTLLLSAILKGTLVARKCAKDFVRYLILDLEGELTDELQEIRTGTDYPDAV
ncbi:MAG TPA: hypothetical protein QF813_00370, partial [Alphaproteobacteria bacterium]|nr:hypothetical protein [Alphaproteobacteria bacterium]